MRNCDLPLQDGEIVERRSAGAFSPKPSGRWRIGEWIKTNRNLLFFQGGNATFSVTLNSFMEISSCAREYSFKNARCLRISFNNGTDNKTFWLMTPDIAAWEEKLSENLEESLTENDIVKVANCLGHSAEKILWHLYRRRHATIGELMEIAGAESHMDALNIVRKEINQAASNIIGRPVLIFKPEGADRNGRRVAYSWWFACGKIIGDSPFCDIIDEKEFYRIIVESPPDTENELEGNQLHLKNRCGFAYSITLPPNASHSIQSKSYRNGVLEICILKESEENNEAGNMKHEA